MGVSAGLGCLRVMVEFSMGVKGGLGCLRVMVEFSMGVKAGLGCLGGDLRCCVVVYGIYGFTLGVVVELRRRLG